MKKSKIPAISREENLSEQDIQYILHKKIPPKVAKALLNRCSIEVTGWILATLHTHTNW